MLLNLWNRLTTMTRETKLGVVVSCSFLGLLGAVLALKMTEVPGQEPGPDVTAAAPQDSPGASPQANAAPGSDKNPAGSGRAPSVLPPAVEKGSSLIVQAGATTPSPAAPAAAGGLPPLAAGGSTPEHAGREKTEGDDMGLPGLPPAESAGTTKPPPPAPGAPSRPAPATEAAGGFWSGLVAWAHQVGATAPPAIAAAPAAPGKGSDIDLPPIPADTSIKNVKPPPPAVADGGGRRGTIGAPPPLSPRTGTDPKEKTPAGQVNRGGGDKAIPAGTLVTKANEPKTGGLPDLPPAPPLPAPAGSPAPLPPVPGGSGGSPAAPTDTLRPVPLSAPLPPAPAARVDVPVKPVAVVPAFEVKTGGPTPPGEISAPPLKPAAPPESPVRVPAPIVVPGTPTAKIPPLPVAAAPSPVVRGAEPDVVSYVEETYTAAAGDTFQSISRAHYSSDRYAQALYLFNRSHPLAEDDVSPDKPLNAKQKVYIPPAEILESRYPDQIKADAPPVAKPSVTVGSSPTRPVASPAAAAGPPTYRVASGGEFEYDIAKRLLGDGNRWPEIYKLNPGWKPEQPVPPGATLTLPAGAKLP